MALTPETLPRHELIGLHVRVVESTDPSRVGIEGRVVRETMRTLVIAEVPDTEGTTQTDGVSGARELQVPKAGTTYEFRLTDEAAVGRKAAGTVSKPESDESQTPGEVAAYVTVDGVKLLSRPALRSENGVDSKWR